MWPESMPYLTGEVRSPGRRAQGSYYVREGVPDYNETWGLLTSDWTGLRSPALVAELRALQPRTLGRWDGLSRALE
jgi:hypothetical protein